MVCCTWTVAATESARDAELWAATLAATVATRCGLALAAVAVARDQGRSVATRAKAGCLCPMHAPSAQRTARAMRNERDAGAIQSGPTATAGPVVWRPAVSVPKERPGSGCVAMQVTQHRPALCKNLHNQCPAKGIGRAVCVEVQLRRQGLLARGTTSLTERNCDLGIDCSA